MPTSFTYLLNTLTVPAFQASLGGDVLFMNEAMQRLFGSESDPDKLRTIFGMGLFSNHAEFRGFLRGFNTVGRVQRIRLPATRLRHPKRQVVLNAVLHETEEERTFIGILNISEPAATSARVLSKSEEEPRIDDLPYFVFITDEDGNLQFANVAARVFLDLGPQDSLGEFRLSDIDLDFTPGTWRERILRARKEGDHSYETNFRRPNRTILPVCVTIMRVEGFPVRKVTFAVHSLSNLRRVEAELRNKQLQIDDLRRMRERDQLLQQEATAAVPPREHVLVSASQSYQPILRQIEQVAPTDSTVLITGETGTGKELVARAIYRGSKRHKEPFITVNCGALPKDLIESELFGHRKGAFTGATRDKAGQFKLADGGTLFLDEVGEMPLDLQTRLLRFLQEGEFTPVGADKAAYADVRVIAATNRDLVRMVREGEFRTDLFFRLNVFPIHNIPLRERTEDIPLLLDHFIQKHARRLNRDIQTFDPAVLPTLVRYPFPGNVRELENIVERGLILSAGNRLTLDWDVSAAIPQLSTADDNRTVPSPEEHHHSDLPTYAAGTPPSSADDVLGLEEMTRRYISEVLRLTDGKVSGPGGAAELLEIKPQTLFSKIRKLEIER